MQHLLWLELEGWCMYITKLNSMVFGNVVNIESREVSGDLYGLRKAFCLSWIREWRGDACCSMRQWCCSACMIFIWLYRDTTHGEHVGGQGCPNPSSVFCVSCVIWTVTGNGWSLTIKEFICPLNSIIFHWLGVPITLSMLKSERESV